MKLLVAFMFSLFVAWGKDRFRLLIVNTLYDMRHKIVPLFSSTPLSPSRRPPSITPTDVSSTYEDTERIKSSATTVRSDDNYFIKRLRSQPRQDIIFFNRYRDFFKRTTGVEKNKFFRDYILWRQEGLDVEKQHCLFINFGVNMMLEYPQIRRVIIIFS